MEVSDRQKSSEELIREAKESLLRPPTKREPAPPAESSPETSQAQEPEPIASRPRRTSARQAVATNPEPMSASARPTSITPQPESHPGPAPSRDQSASPVRTGWWKFIAFITLGWVIFGWISIITAIFDQPSDVLELMLGGVVMTLLPFLIGVYAIRRGRRERAAATDRLS